MTKLSEQIRGAETLEALYALVPVLDCRTGKCSESCGPIGMSPEESRRVDVAFGSHIPNAALRELPVGDLTCPALSMLGRCRVYAARPMLCRLWGASEAMPCPDGCEPVGGHLLTPDETRALLDRALEIGA